MAWMTERFWLILTPQSPAKNPIHGSIVLVLESYGKLSLIHVRNSYLQASVGNGEGGLALRERWNYFPTIHEQQLPPEATTDCLRLSTSTRPPFHPAMVTGDDKSFKWNEVGNYILKWLPIATSLEINQQVFFVGSRSLRYRDQCNPRVPLANCSRGFPNHFDRYPSGCDKF